MRSFETARAGELLLVSFLQDPNSLSIYGGPPRFKGSGSGIGRTVALATPLTLNPPNQDVLVQLGGGIFLNQARQTSAQCVLKQTAFFFPPVAFCLKLIGL